MQAAESAHVHLVVHRVHDGPRAEEHVRLEEAVGDEMEDGEGRARGAEGRGEHHVADLGHRGGGEDLLHVVLGRADDRPEHQRDRAYDGDGQLRRGACGVDEAGTHHEVDAGGDHRGRVDEGGDRSRAGHRVAEPGLKRELGGLSARADEQQNADRKQSARPRLGGAGCDAVESHRAERRDHEHHRGEQADVAHAVHDEGLLACGRVSGNLVPEGDEEVGGEPHALPADEHHRVGVAEDEQQHRGDEQVEIGEETGLGRVVFHVPDGVDVDEGSDEGHQHEEGDGQRIDPQGEIDGEVARRKPPVQPHPHRPFFGGCADELDERRRAHEQREARSADGQPMAPAFDPLSGDEQNARGKEGDGDAQPHEGRSSRSRSDFHSQFTPLPVSA